MGLSIGKRLAFAQVILVFTFGMLEGVARLLPDRISGRREVVQNPDPGSEIMVSSEEVPGWDLNYPQGDIGGFPYTTNHWRMRGPEYPDEKADNVVRIILVGDSSIFGYLLSWEETMGAQLERLRERRFADTDYQVASCAAPGHTSLQSIYKLDRQCMAFQPDVVIIGNLNSDGTDYYVADKDRFHTPAFDGPAVTLQRSALYRTLRNLWLGQQIKRDAAALAEAIPQLNRPESPSGKVRRVAVPDYKENLRQLVQIARRGGATPIFLALPWRSTGNSSAPRSRQERLVAMHEVATSEGVPLADGPGRFAQLPEMANLFLDPVHPGKTGAQVLAVLLDETLGPNKP